MESDDERELHELEQAQKEGRRYYRRSPWSTPLKLQDVELAHHMHLDSTDVKNGTISGNGPTKMLMFIRFCWSVSGFYKGTLDLSGRHERRYRSVMARWTLLVVDISNVRMSCASYSKDCVNSNGSLLNDVQSHPMKEPLYVSTMPSVEAAFRKKWALPSSHLSLSILFHLTDETVRDIRKHQVPRFQTLTLMKMPSEILHIIMGFASPSDARLLGSTCRRLNSIGSGHTFEFSNLQMTGKIGTPPEARRAAILNATPYSRQRLLAVLGFLNSHPDAQKRVKNMTIGNNLTYYFELLDELGAKTTDDSFRRVFTGWARAVSNCGNLTALSFSCMTVTLDLLRATMSLPRLYSVDMYRVRFSRRTGVLVSLGKIPSSSSIINVRICNTGGVVDPWWFVALCPQVRSLSLVGSANRSIMYPTDECRRLCNPFTTLERLSIWRLENRYPDAIPVLTSWIRTAAAAVSPLPLPLTHLLLGTTRRLSAFAQDDLIGALHGLQLRSLVLDGLAHTRPALLTQLAAAVPGLEALTLMYLANHNAALAPPCVWPHATWEYAAALGAFARLRHFAWNNRLQPEPEVVYSCDMPALEAGYSDAVGFYDGLDPWWLDGCVMRLFHWHCRTLTTFGLCYGQEMRRVWTIPSVVGEQVEFSLNGHGCSEENWPSDNVWRSVVAPDGTRMHW